MKKHLRLALPPLARLVPGSPCAFALVDRHGALLRAGELPLDRIAAEVPVEPLHAFLAPGDAITVSVPVPPLPPRQMDAAVASAIEPLALSDIADLCIAHGPRGASGEAAVAWAERRAIARAWELLDAAGLQVAAIVPHELALPADDPHPDSPLSLPADARWLAPLPGWSLARSDVRPASRSRPWRGAIAWAGAAALLWLAGLHFYAGQQEREIVALQDGMQGIVQETFPQIPMVIAPLKQAADARDALRLARGVAGGDDFMPLALGAARVLPFAAGHVRAMRFAEGTLTLTLAEGYAPPGNEAALVQAAAAQVLSLEKDKQLLHTWHVRRATSPAQAGAQGGAQGGGRP